MNHRIRGAVALALLGALALTSCTGDDAPEESPTVITAPPPTPIGEPDPSDGPKPELPQFDELDTSDWRLAEANDGRASLRIPPSWGWQWRSGAPAGTPAGHLIDTVTLSSVDGERIFYEDSLEPPEQCTGDGDAELLDLAPLPADGSLSLVAIAVTEGASVQFAAGVVDTERAEAVGCGLSFFNDAEVPYRASTTPIVPDDSVADHWVFSSADEARQYVLGDEYALIRASLLSFQPPA